MKNGISIQLSLSISIILTRTLILSSLLPIIKSFLFSIPTTKRIPFTQQTLQTHKTNTIQDVTIIGGGISGLAAGITLKENTVSKSNITKVLLVEKDSTIGGRVQSEKVYNSKNECFICDKGFAVFIENYPASQKLLNYTKLGLCRFLPGALIYKNNKLNKIGDPIRYPSAFLSTFVSSLSLGTLKDKLLLLPLVYNIRTKSIKTLMTQNDTSTYTALSEKYKFSNGFIKAFWEPFLKGIYFSDLEHQSSRMFHFALKMFLEGYVSLPRDGMQGVSDQLLDTITANDDDGLEIVMNRSVCNITQVHIPSVSNRPLYQLQLSSKVSEIILTKKVILATDAITTKTLLSNLPKFQFLKEIPNPVQNNIICMYYAFQSPPPVTDSLLVLISRNEDENVGPINNLCFPSVVNDNYAPDGYSLCSISVLPSYLTPLNITTNNTTKLDELVRTHLIKLFPNHDINSWELLKVYHIKNAQPSTLEGAYPANVYGGRDCTMYYNERLPDDLFLCGDFMGTASFNGALESGVTAAMAVINSTKIIA